MKQKPKLHIRWMIRKDMPEVLSIEARAFDYPWDEDTFIRVLRQRNCIGMVAISDNGDSEKVLGYMIYELWPKRLGLLNFAVDYDERRQGVGRAMLEKLFGKLSEQRRAKISLEVMEANVDAQKFFAANGFRAVGVLHDFYEDTDRDAYQMEYRINEAELALT